VLGKLIEKYLFISVGRYQFEWLQRPGVIAILAVTALVLASPRSRRFIECGSRPRSQHPRSLQTSRRHLPRTG